jgi:hypothetical protein
MKNDKLYTCVGTSTKEGVTKVNFTTNRVFRMKMIGQANRDDVTMVDLPHPMSKLDAVNWLLEGTNIGGLNRYAVEDKKMYLEDQRKQESIRTALDGTPRRRGRPAKVKVEVVPEAAVSEG